MRIAVFAVTKHGRETAQRITEALGDAKLSNFSPRLVEEAFRSYDALVFVMALGIVVRTISGLISDKRSDPAVVAVDEKGRHVISVLSGHRGANELTREIAAHLGSDPVITTATDVQGKPSVEDIARMYKLVIDEESQLKEVNAAIVNDKEVGVHIDLDSNFNLSLHLSGNMSICDSPNDFDALVIITNKIYGETKQPRAVLRPRNLVVGIGAKKGISSKTVLDAIAQSFETAELSMGSIAALATADFKAGERGIVKAAHALAVPLLPVSSELIRENEGLFKGSREVKAKVGVSAVCEPSAVLAGKGAKLIQGKTKFAGVTIAIAEEDYQWERSS
ncbi:MAG: cobalt-precorrin 5A hydrolase [Candidatus Hydrothermarchaeales archaeon]